MKLEHVGKSFADAHPFISWLGDYSILLKIGFIGVIAMLVLILTFVLPPKKEELKTSKARICLKIINFIAFGITTLIFIVFIISSTSLLWLKANGQKLTYEGQGQVVDVAPIEKSQVQDITFEHKGKKYKISQPTKVAQKLHRGDRLKLINKIEHDVKSNPQYNDYQNKDGSFKKEMNIQDHMDELEIERQ